MGYYVELIGANFTIPRDKWDEAFEALVELNEHDELKTGGRWGADGSEEKWFAWMDADYPATARQACEEGLVEHPLLAVMYDLFREEMGEYGGGFEVTEHGLQLVYHSSKMGNEEHFLRALAPFVPPGSHLDWRGEDGDMWRQEFDGKTMTTKVGRVVFVD